MTGCQPPRSFTVSGATGGAVYLERAFQPEDLGGRPAVVSGTIALTAGSVIYLVVGQTPGISLSPSTAGQYGGGGGGTFVFLNNLATPLLVAGMFDPAHAPRNTLHVCQLRHNRVQLHVLLK